MGAAVSQVAARLIRALRAILLPAKEKSATGEPFVLGGDRLGTVKPDGTIELDPGWDFIPLSAAGTDPTRKERGQGNPEPGLMPSAVGDTR
jgi:hypothetical protein